MDKITFKQAAQLWGSELNLDVDGKLSYQEKKQKIFEFVEKVSTNIAGDPDASINKTRVLYSP